MNDNDIVKALEICQKAKYAGDCEHMGCPARTKQGCRFYSRTDEDEDHDMVIPDEMFNASIDLIKRQKAEIAELEAEIDKQYEQAKADILGNMSNGGTSCHWCIDKHRTEAIKEFAERFKERCGTNCDSAIIWAKGTIDNLVKEMTEETP